MPEQRRDEFFKALFERLDDPKRWDYPPDFNYAEATARFRAFVSDLESSTGQSFRIESGSMIQDASFHSQILLPGAYLRFSNFGDMAATTDDDLIALDVLKMVRERLADHGYVFVPHDLLEEPYSGSNPGVTGIRDWWIRYFDWV